MSAAGSSRTDGKPVAPTPTGGQRRLCLLDALDGGYACFGPDGRLVDFNQGFRDVYLSLSELDETTLRGMAFADLARLVVENGEIAGDLASRDPQAWLDERLARFATPGPAQIERLADGRYMEVIERRTADGGTVVRWTDITARTAALMRLEDALESAGDGFALWDQRLRLVRCNKDFAVRHGEADAPPRPGLPMRALFLALADAGRLVIDAEPERWIEARLAEWARPLAESVLEYADGRHYLLRCRRTRDGGLAMLLTDVTDMRAKERQLADRGETLENAVLELEMTRATLEGQAADLIGLAEDAALAREKAEQERQKAEASRALLQANEAKLRAILGTIGDALLTIDVHGSIRSANPAAERMFGWPVEDMVGRSVALVLPGEEDGRLDRDLAGGPHPGERQARRRDGTAFPVELTIGRVEGDHRRDHLYVATIRDITERKAAEARLRELATTDPLTGAANRRAFLENAESALALAERNIMPVSVLACDIDHFKRINDTFGHGIGDEALKAFVTAVRSALRKTDVLGRLGGEEFAILLPGTPQDRAALVAERIRATIAALVVPTDDAESSLLRFTVSIGLAVAAPGEAVDDVLGRADAALYAAKGGGRNRVVAASAPPSPPPSPPPHEVLGSAPPRHTAS